MAYYDYGIKKSTENTEIFFHRGLAHVSLHNYEKGIEDFEVANKTPPSSPGDTIKFKILLNLGINLRRINKLEESITYLKKACDLSPNKPQAHNNLGLSYFEKEEWDEALSSYTKAINLESALTIE